MRTALAIILFCSSILFPQNLEEQFRFAAGLYSSEKYFDAVTEFKRLQFFDKENVYAVKAEYYTGLSYKTGGFYSEAIKYFSNAALKTADPDTLYLLQTEIIKSNILRRTTARAFQLISELKKTAGTEKIKEIDYLSAFAYVFSDRWIDAAQFFEKSGHPDFAEVCRRTEDEKYSAVKAKIFSGLVPGSGQFYTGNYINGIISLAINAAALYLTIDAFTDNRIFDGIVIGNFLWFRFYTGGISNAGKFAEENNNIIINKALKYLQNSEHGLGD